MSTHHCGTQSTKRLSRITKGTNSTFTTLLCPYTQLTLNFYVIVLSNANALSVESVIVRTKATLAVKYASKFCT